jgi:flagellar protein FliO/FliZ
MLQSLGNLVSLDNRAVQITIAVVVVLVLAGVLFGLYRLVFAHRLRVPGGTRGRAPRLGVVDVFALDAQRQLVIVRRDNVEHLLMIGGPNDLVVEPQILRNAINGVNGRESAKPSPAAEPAAEAPPPAVLRPVAPASSSRPTQLRPVAHEPPPPVVSSTAEPNAAELDPRARPAPSRGESKPADVVAARSVEVAAVENKPAAESMLRRPQAAPKPVAPTPAPVAIRPNLPSPITPLRARQSDPAPPVEPPKPAAAEPAKAPDVVIIPPAPAPSAPAPTVIVPPASSDKPRSRPEDTFYDLESLEAEMARLLGRDS